MRSVWRMSWTRCEISTLVLFAISLSIAPLLHMTSLKAVTKSFSFDTPQTSMTSVFQPTKSCAMVWPLVSTAGTWIGHVRSNRFMSMPDILCRVGRLNSLSDVVAGHNFGGTLGSFWESVMNFFWHVENVVIIYYSQQVSSWLFIHSDGRCRESWG